MNTNGRAFFLLHFPLVPAVRSRAGTEQVPAPHLPANALTTREQQAEHHSQAPDGGYNYLPALWSSGQEYLLSPSCVISTATSSRRRQNPLSITLALPLPESRKWGEGLAPLSSWSNFTHWFFSINKLVTFAPHLAGEVSNNTLIPSENMNHWHAGGSGYLPPDSLLLTAPHISRGQALAWAGAGSRTRAMASRHCHGAQRFSLRGRTDNFEPRQCAAFFSCQSYLVCI